MNNAKALRGSRSIVYDLLRSPVVYKTAQAVLAPGMKHLVGNCLKQAICNTPKDAPMLDVGCGPASWLWDLDRQPFGLDLSHEYTLKYRGAGGHCITASASEVPFASNSFALVICVALLHHLPDEVARETVRQMVRVTRPGGRVVIFDPVFPHSPFTRPVAYSLCKLDRGEFIRTQSGMESRILAPFNWTIQRINHSYLGTEGLICACVKP